MVAVMDFLRLSKRSSVAVAGLLRDLGRERERGGRDRFMPESSFVTKQGNETGGRGIS